MVLVDTSVWIELFRDGSGRKRRVLEDVLAGEEIVLSRFHQLELLQGSRDETEWGLLEEYLDAQEYLELSDESWSKAGRIFFDLRRTGRTVRGPIDCCIAQVAIDHGALLVHRDRDFETIAAIRPLRHVRLAWS
jgi:predicted nucleic acid-binding protein